MPLRVGLVGYGEIAQYHTRHLTAAGARVVGVVTSRPLDADLRRYASLTDMLPHVDAVSIAVPNHLHAGLCLEAVRAEKPVFVEKPLCIRATELDALTAALTGTRVPVWLGYRLRWNPALRALHERLRAVRYVRCTYRIGIERLAAGKPWTRRQAESGGAFFTLGVHALDLARWLAGARGDPLSERAVTAMHQDGAADFPLLVTLRGILPGGTVVEAGADLRGSSPFELDLYIEADEGRYPDPTLPAPAPEDDGAAHAEYAGLMAAFVQAATGGAVDRPALAEALQTHHDLIWAAQVAAD